MGGKARISRRASALRSRRGMKIPQLGMVLLLMVAALGLSVWWWMQAEQLIEPSGFSEHHSRAVNSAHPPRVPDAPGQISPTSVRAVPKRIRHSAEMGEWRSASIFLPKMSDEDELRATSERGFLEVEIDTVTASARGIQVAIRLRALKTEFGEFEDRVHLHSGSSVAVVLVSGNAAPPRPSF